MRGVKGPTTLISVKLETKMYRALKEYCEENDIYMTVFVRGLIGKELAKKKFSIPEEVAYIKPRKINEL